MQQSMAKEKHKTIWLVHHETKWPCTIYLMYLLCLLFIVHSEGCKIHKNKVFAVLSTDVFQPLLPNSNCLLIHSSTVWDHYFMLPFPSKTFQSFCIFTFCSSTMLLISLIKVTVFGRELPPSPAVTPAHRPASAPSTLPSLNEPASPMNHPCPYLQPVLSSVLWCCGSQPLGNELFSRHDSFSLLPCQLLCPCWTTPVSSS